MMPHRARAARRLAAAAGAMVIAVTLFVSGVANAQSNGGVRVMPLGDSITDGFNVPGGYRVELWQSLVGGGYTVDFVGSQSNGPASLGDRDHEGHSGWTISQIDANVESWLGQTIPRTVLLHIGTNDMFQDPGGAPARLSTLIDRIVATVPEADVFVATIIPFPAAAAAVQTYNAAIPGIVASKGPRVHLVDMFSALTASDLADGVHPNAGGYAKMAAVWFDALESVPGSIGGNPPSSPPSSPPASPPPSSAPPTSAPPPAGGACTAAYQVVNAWPGGFQAGVTVTAGGEALTGWTVQWTFPGGQSVTQLWNGTLTTGGGSVSVSNAAYNGAVPAGGSTTFGFLASGADATPTDLRCTSP